LENKEKMKQNARKYYLENKEKKKESTRKYNLKNKEKIKQSVQKYKEMNRESICQNERAYYEKNQNQIKMRNLDRIRQSRLYTIDSYLNDIKKGPTNIICVSCGRLFFDRSITCLTYSEILAKSMFLIL
jgi:hypothetical protein